MLTSKGASSEPGLDPRIERWLRAGAGGAAPCQDVIETSTSWVFLYEDRALKLKKSVHFDFLDFSTPDQRAWATRRELLFNRMTAPDLYRAVHAVTLAPSGRVELNGDGEVLDWVLEMRRFAGEALLSRNLPVDGALGEALGREIARVHLAAEQGAAGGGAAGLAYVIASNAAQLRACLGVLERDAVEDLIAATQAAFEPAREGLERRSAQGFCRACHGDLHTANIIVEAGAPLLFDGIEFNDRLREIDIEYDLAFLLMDLAFKGSLDGANRALNGWLDATARVFDGAIWGGLSLLPLFQSVRATVRAHVNAREGKAEAARRYLAAGRDHLRASAARLIAVGGLSGSGKSTWARRHAPGLGGAPGAVILRSDEIRKRLWNGSPLERLGPQAYVAAANARVYEAMRSAARDCLAAGRSVIADAVFLDPAQRAAIETVAREAGVAFEGVWLEAPPQTLTDRLVARRGDASDADVGVLQRQRLLDPGEITWRRQASA